MFRKRFYYLIELQYLGFRYHGWQKQKQAELKTVEGMVQKTLKWILKDIRFKTLASGRTDAKVSANQAAFELFVEEVPLEMDSFLIVFNENLPADIRALSIREVDERFNIINQAKQKEYLYLFSFGEKPHPFAASLMVNIPNQLDIALMQEGAKLFIGRHWFKNYCARPSPTAEFYREVTTCTIMPNTIYTANFFPKESYVLRVCGPGFMRYQIRLMMGALFSLGKGALDLTYLKDSLIEGSENTITWVAPSSGLILNSVVFDEED